LNKNLWTSSFVLWTCGWGSLLLSFFYWTIDVRGWLRGFGAFFAVIGMNSVLIYLSGKFINYDYTARFLFGGLAVAVPPAVGTLVIALGVFAVEWALFWFLQRQKIFLKV
jgi:predicted acyltransferase